MITTHAAPDLLDVARQYAANPQDWPFAPRFNPRHRWYQRLAATADSEAWLLTWLPGQGTDLHDHGGSAGAFLVISGTLTEHTLTEHTLTGRHGAARLHGRRYGPGQGHPFGAQHVHQVTNDSGRPAVSLHVYRPVLGEMTRYRIAGGRLEVTAVDRAGDDW